MKKRRCAWCGHWFQPKTYKSQYCSQGCSQKGWWAARRQHLKKRRCAWCGHWFQPSCKHAFSCGRRCARRLSLTRKRHALKQRMVSYKGGCCQCCGYMTCIAALEFHHRRRGAKDLTVRIVGAWAWSAKLRRELDKCDLVCANCHREIHNPVR